MTIYNGNEFIIKIETDGIFENIEGIYNSKLSLSNKFIRSNSIQNNHYQKFDMIKNTYLFLNISGLYTDSKAEKKIRHLALKGKIERYKIILADNNIINVNLVITNYELEGNIRGEEKYNIDLISSGEILYDQKK